jgi:alkyldihydroxyacetonephosphate synthase
MTLNETLLADLENATHAGAVSAERNDRLAHARDWWPEAAKWDAATLAAHEPCGVVRPHSEEECQEIVRICARHDAAIVPFGAGSGVVGAAIPAQGSVVVDTRQMDRVVAFDETNCIVTVEPGCIGRTLENWLNERGFTLGHYPQSLPLATIGGLVSTRSTGTFSNKYGGIEDLVLGLRVVLPDARIAAFRPVPRSSAGPALQQLFIGAEGAFGLITQVTLRVFPRAERRLFEGYVFPTVAAGVEAVRKAYAAHLRPAVLRLYDAVEAQGLYGRVNLGENRPLLICGFEGLASMARAEQEAFAAIARSCSGESLGSAIGEAWEGHRYDASWLTAGNEGPNKMADAIEVAFTWSDLAPAYEAIMADIRLFCAKAMGHYSHFYSTGGALYLIVLLEGSDTQDVQSRYRDVWRRVMDHTLARGGSIAHHHGVGLARAPHLVKELSGSHALLGRLKLCLDPKGTFNPGKFGLAASEA